MRSIRQAILELFLALWMLWVAVRLLLWAMRGHPRLLLPILGLAWRLILPKRALRRL